MANSNIYHLFSFLCFITLAGCGGFESTSEGHSQFSQSTRTQTDLLVVSEKLVVQKSSVQTVAGATFDTVNKAAAEGDYSQFEKFIAASGTKWTALLDNECLQEALEDDFSKVLANQEFDLRSLAQKQVAYSFKLQEDISLRDLALKLDATGCAVRMENEIDDVSVTYVNDPDYQSGKQNYLKDLKAQFAKTILNSVTHSQDVIVAVLDTGLDDDHEDIDRQMLWRDQRGFRGIDFANNDFDPNDGHNHGTFVSSIIAADSDNGVGMAGVATQGVKIMPIKVLSDKGSGISSNIVNGIYYAIENGAHVINMSLGSAKESVIMQKAIQDAIDNGIVVVSAAGNSGLPLSDSYFISPAGYAHQQRGHIAVGALETATTLARFSNFGSNWVELAAPGVNIHGANKQNAYAVASGTSAASPMVAGAAAVLIYQKLNSGQGYTPGEIEDFILQNSTKTTSLQQQVSNGQSLNFELLSKELVQRGPASEPPLQVPVTPTPEPPQDPVSDPSAAKIFLGALDSVEVSEADEAVIIKGWGCQYNDLRRPTISIFYDAKMNEDYTDIATQSGLPSPTQVHTACGRVGDFNFAHSIPFAKIAKLRMEGMAIMASIGIPEIDTTGTGNFQLERSGQLDIPAIPASAYDFLPPLGQAPVIEGLIEEVVYRTDLKRVEVSGWACEVGDPLPAAVSLAGEREDGTFITTDVVDQANLASSNLSRQICKTNADHGFKAYFRLNSIDTWNMEGRRLKVRANGAYRKGGNYTSTSGLISNGPVELPNPNSLLIPVITEAERNTPVPEPVTEKIGAITSILFNANTSKVEVRGWACEVGVSGTTKIEILSELTRGGNANRYADTTLPSTPAIEQRCGNQEPHNFFVEQRAYIDDANRLLSEGGLRLFLVNGPNGEFKNLLQTYALPVIPEQVQEHEMLGAVTTVTFDRVANQLVVRGWLCEKGLAGSLNYRLDIMRNGLNSRASLSYKQATLASSNSIRNTCESNGRYNFEQVISGADLERFQITEGSKVRIYGYSNQVGGSNKMIGADANYLVPSLD